MEIKSNREGDGIEINRQLINGLKVKGTLNVIIN